MSDPQGYQRPISCYFSSSNIHRGSHKRDLSLEWSGHSNGNSLALLHPYSTSACFAYTYSTGMTFLHLPQAELVIVLIKEVVKGMPLFQFL